MAYSRAPVVVNLTDTIEEMRVEVNAITAKLNELFDGANFVTGGADKPALITSPVLAGSVTGTYIFTNPTINAATITGTVASTAVVTGTLDLTDTVLAGGSPLVFEGNTANEYELTIQIANPTATQAITFPNASGTISLVDLAETLVNKTLLMIIPIKI